MDQSLGRFVNAKTSHATPTRSKPVTDSVKRDLRDTVPLGRRPHPERFSMIDILPSSTGTVGLIAIVGVFAILALLFFAKKK
ncbi:hypothetical protein BH10PSE9_BH10PSE9_17140 [soil metagenome]